MERLPNYHGCFVCGDRNPTGLRVRFMTDGEKVWTTFTPSEQQKGYHGITHGGVLAALLDETMGWAPTLKRGRFCMCVELNMEYRKSVPIGTQITVTGWMTDGSRRIWECAGEIRGADGTLYVRGKGRFMPIGEEPSRAILEYLTFDEGCVPAERLCPKP
ncbi:MAG TPA: PaaI family thioesterase [Chthonomonadales bacterium]|nr:PaaI family thioesterase [Chthonomonadales bacterium]